MQADGLYREGPEPNPWIPLRHHLLIYLRSCNLMVIYVISVFLGFKKDMTIPSYVLSTPTQYFERLSPRRVRDLPKIDTQFCLPQLLGI